MPRSEMFLHPKTLTRFTLDCEDLTRDLVDGVRVTLKIYFSDNTTATIMSKVMEGEEVANLPNEALRLVEAFLWGEGPKAVVAWAQRQDRSTMSRKVRGTL